MDIGERQNFIDTVKKYISEIETISERNDITQDEKTVLRNKNYTDLFTFLSEPNHVITLISIPRLRNIVESKAHAFLGYPYISGNARHSIEQYYEAVRRVGTPNAGKRKSKKTIKRKNRKTRRHS